MELESEDGRGIFLHRGCKKELGRGPGLAWRDKTVSRRQIVLELPEDGGVPSNAVVEVVGPNPICILRRHGDQILELGSKFDRPREGDVEFLERGGRGVLEVGDKLSLSITNPIFLTLKASGDLKAGHHKSAVSARSEFAEQPSGQVEIQGDHASRQLLKEAKEEDDLLEAWRSRKMAKKGGSSNRELEDGSREKDGPGQRSSSASPETDNLDKLNEVITDKISEQKPGEQFGSKEEEEGIAKAVARRKRLGLGLQDDRRKQLEESEWKSKTMESSNASSSKDAANGKMEIEQADDTHSKLNRLPQFDPVTDFGFLVEGSEFDKFKGRKSFPQKFDWHLDKTEAADSSTEEEGGAGESNRSTRKRNKKYKSTIRKNNAHGHTETEDEDWEGESEEEQLLVTRAKKPRRQSEVRTRSRDNRVSNLDENEKMAQKKTNNVIQNRNANDEEDDLSGFIVEDEEEEVDDDAEEDEWQDDGSQDELDEEGDQDENSRKGSKKGLKPLCKYGSKCYRKNKEHLLQFRHL